MKNTEKENTRNQIVEGIKLSAQKMIQNKKRLGQKMVVSSKGIIREFYAEELEC